MQNVFPERAQLSQTLPLRKEHASWEGQALPSGRGVAKPGFPTLLQPVLGDQTPSDEDIGYQTRQSNPFRYSLSGKLNNTG